MKDKTPGVVPPYLAENYNVKLQEKTDDTHANSALARTINALMDCVNERNAHLPKYLLVIIDWDIVNDLDLTDLDSLKMIPILVNWFTRQISVILRRKRVDLLERKPGAVYSNTKVIYVRMLKRIGQFGDNIMAVNSLRAKFNNALNDAAAKLDQYILTVNSCNLYEHFDHKGGLSEIGQKMFFEEIDDLIHRFEFNRVKLLPTPKNPTALQHNTRRNGSQAGKYRDPAHLHKNSYNNSHHWESKHDWHQRDYHY